MIDVQGSWKHTIIQAVVGSTAHGLNVSDSIEDRDEMGVLVEPFEDFAGFDEFEQLIYRSAAVREQRQDARSKAGDLDLCIYSLKKYLRLALKGNPTIMILLFAPPEKLVVSTESGAQLQSLAPYLVSRKAGSAFMGYLQAQRMRLTGERGQKDVKRPELEEAYGFDTKYAMHMLRLGFQGVELMTTGRLTLPMPDPQRSWLLGVRTGKVTLQECLTRAGELERELKDLWEHSSLPRDPDRERVQKWMLQTYRAKWEESNDDKEMDHP